MGAFEVSGQVTGMAGQGWSSGTWVWWGSDCCTCCGPWLPHSSSWESVGYVSGWMDFLILNSGLCWLTHLATSSAGQEWPPTSPRPWLPCLHWGRAIEDIYSEGRLERERIGKMHGPWLHFQWSVWKVTLLRQGGVLRVGVSHHCSSLPNPEGTIRMERKEKVSPFDRHMVGKLILAYNCLFNSHGENSPLNCRGSEKKMVPKTYMVTYTPPSQHPLVGEK